MSKQSSSENTDSISLFPFLAVLLCTMGALLVLLVILVQRAAEQSLLPTAATIELGVAQSTSRSQPAIDAEQAELKKALAEVASYQQQLDELQAEGAERLENERLRLSHSEQHSRRLEEELAKLAIAAEQLKQTESNQTVDQKQAEEELERLEQLIIDTEKQLEALEDAPQGNKPYAIIPYKGPNGTFRKPIYIECTHQGITIQPEGLQLVKDDFIATSWPGNPLAAVLRATREYLNDKAKRAGEPEPPDPYPLIIVRPSGIQAYIRARAAIAAWDPDYGYEFIEEDMKLTYRDAADPQLAQVQHHALMIARERLVHMVQAAPSRFPRMRFGEGSTYGGGGGSGESMGGFGAEGGNGAYAGGGGGLGSPDGDGSMGGGGGFAGDDPSGSQQAENGPTGDNESQFGVMAGDQTSGAPNGGGVAGGGTSDVAPNGDASLVGDRYAQQGSGGDGSNVYAPSEPLDGKDRLQGGTAGNQQMAGSSASGGPQDQTSSSGSSLGAPGSSGGPMAVGSIDNQSQGHSAEIPAQSRGANWAINQPRQKSVAIRRTIRVAVRQNTMILLPNKNIHKGAESQAQEISLDQPVDKISDEFASAIKARIDDWGLGGSGMYWKPVLELNVEPGAIMTANRITHLLKDSGVEVQLPETAQNGTPLQGGTVR